MDRTTTHLLRGGSRRPRSRPRCARARARIFGRTPGIAVGIALGLATLATAPAVHAAPGPRIPKSGFGVRVPSPRGQTADRYGTGWGLIGSSLRTLSPRLRLLSEISWTKLPAKGDSITVGTGNDVQTIQIDDISALGLAIGPVLSLGTLEIGAKGGYFFGDLDEWAILPFAQLTISRFTLGAELKQAGEIEWWAGYANIWF
jgi:hypothetical protein